MKLVKLPAKGRVIFVGDTHGDSNVSEDIIRRYLKSDNRIVFLGDYVDRGYDSSGNVDFLLDTRAKNPKQVYLLQGNHEGYMIESYNNADFWYSLDSKEQQRFFNIFKEFPYAVSVDGIIAVHGALPNVKNLSDINKIRIGSSNWKALTWGDYSENEVFYNEGLRKSYFQGDFEKTMQRLGKKVLIRSHDPGVPVSIYDGKCVTLFSTSSVRRGGERTIAIADFSKHPKVKTIDDLIIERF